VLAKRIIACLDVRDGVVVKGVQFGRLRRAGDPGGLASTRS
jgi:imidazole glycerol-phosphate synthase subunit HisF